METVRIDGSQGEGGGQILRTSLALSALTRKTLEIVNIRARRAKPGLHPQHLQSVQAAAAICSAETSGGQLGSQSLRFAPGEVRSGDYRFTIGTAGSTGLVLQTVYLPLLLAGRGPSTVAITGGTHVPMAPCFHYLDLQWRSFLERIGLRVRVEMALAGYYPRGGGEITARIEPASGVRPLVLAGRGPLVEIRGISMVTGLPMSIAERQKAHAEKRLERLGCPVRIEQADAPGVGQGTMLLLAVVFRESQACYYGLGARGKRAEQVADEAADAVLDFVGGNGDVDEHLADQIVLPLACAGGPSSFATHKVNMHLLTNLDVIARFLPVSFRVDGEAGCPGRVELSPGG